MFIIEDTPFEISSSVLDAFIDEEKETVNWGVEITSQSDAEAFSRWHPKFRSEILISTGVGEISSYLDLAGKNIDQTNRNTDEEDEPMGILYIFEHEPIYDYHIQLGNNNGRLQFQLSATCDIYYNEDFDKNLSLNIDTWLDFKGIWCGRNSESESLELIEPFFNKTDFKYTQTSHGVSLLVPANQ